MIYMTIGQEGWENRHIEQNFFNTSEIKYVLIQNGLFQVKMLWFIHRYPFLVWGNSKNVVNNKGIKMVH